jgi:hypothetical protein
MVFLITSLTSLKFLAIDVFLWSTITCSYCTEHTGGEKKNRFPRERDQYNTLESSLQYPRSCKDHECPTKTDDRHGCAELHGKNPPVAAHVCIDYVLGE